MASQLDYVPAQSRSAQVRLGYIAGLIVLVLAFLGSFYFTLQNDKVSERVMTGEAQKLAKANNLEILDATLAIDLRSYLLTGDKVFLADRQRNLKSFYNQISSLLEMDKAQEFKNTLEKSILNYLLICQAQKT